MLSLQAEYQGTRLQVPLSVQAGQDLKSVTLRMNPPPGIYGTVYDQNGERLAASSVQAFQVSYSPFMRRYEDLSVAVNVTAGDNPPISIRLIQPEP